MVKIFIGNLTPETEKDEVETLFAQYGTVSECAKYKNYAFVHMDDRKSAMKAIRELNFHKLNGRPINVERSRGKNDVPAKLHIANVERGFENELRELFEDYGTVTECAIVKNYAFVHMSNYDEAMDALKDLDNTDFQGKRIHVQVSKSRPRDYFEGDYGPPSDGGGYYPPYHPPERPNSLHRGRPSDYPPPPPPPPDTVPPPMPARPGPYPERAYGDRFAPRMVDYYEKYRARPFLPPSYGERRPIPPPPPPTNPLVRERLGAAPYERRPLPPAPPPLSSSSSYLARDRSPIRRVPLPPPPPAGNGYSFERSRLSPISRPPLYPVARPREPYGERALLPPPPPPSLQRFSNF